MWRYGNSLGGAKKIGNLTETTRTLSTVDVASSERIASAAEALGVGYVRGAVSGTPPVVRAGNAALEEVVNL